MIRRLRPLFFALAGGLAFAGALAQPAVRLTPEVVAGGLQNPWGLAFIGDGRLLVTERPGRLRVVEADGRLSDSLLYERKTLG